MEMDNAPNNSNLKDLKVSMIRSFEIHETKGTVYEILI